MKNILIAGGTGLVGSKLVSLLKEKGHTVSVLSRNPKGEGQFYWNPIEGKIDEGILKEVQVLINLSGAGIADKRWSDTRKKELYQSRIGTNTFLSEKVGKMPNLEQFITSSGINAYGFENPEKWFTETDSFGKDYISQLVKDWEESADFFQSSCKVAKIRTAVVLAKEGGALQKMLPTVKFGIGSPLGTGNQTMCWIHADDLSRLFAHVIEFQLDGAYNGLAGTCSNLEFTKNLAEVLQKSFWFPAVPAFMLQLLFGEMSIILLKGLKASNEKIKSTGFEFLYTDLKAALKTVV
jgi:uncharacterized protein (TIGR01777 family)